MDEMRVVKTLLYFFMFCFNNRKWMNALIIRTFKNSDKVNFKNGRTPFIVGIANFLTAT